MNRGPTPAFPGPLGAWLAAALALAACAPFGPENVISLDAPGARSVFAADLDGDGDLDALSASSEVNRIAWYENTTGDGSAWESIIIAADATQAQSVFAADVDGDGDLDALSASGNADRIAWHENTSGDGSTWTTITVTDSADGTDAVTAADVDGDSDLDIVAASAFDNTIAWYTNTAGDGSAWTKVTVATDAAGAASVAVADMDGDGDLDILSASHLDNKIAWHENTARDGSAWTAHTISLTAEGAHSVFAADVDGDGDLDALSASGNAGRIAWHENTLGDGSAWTEHDITSNAAGARTVFAADLDSDGDLDVLSTADFEDKIAWFENIQGDGSEWAEAAVGPPAGGAWTVLAADIDGDGDLDAVSVLFQDGAIAWHPNLGGQFALSTADTAPPFLGSGQVDDLLRIEAAHRGRAGDGDVELASLDLLLEEGPGDPLTAAEAQAIIANLYVFHDDGSGVFDAGDALVAEANLAALTGGRLEVHLPDNDPKAQAAFGETQTYFVAVRLAAGAHLQTPAQFRITHVTSATSTAQHRDYDFPLRLEYAADTASGEVSAAIPHYFPLIAR